MTGVVRLKPVIGEVTCVLGWGKAALSDRNPCFPANPFTGMRTSASAPRVGGSTKVTIAPFLTIPPAGALADSNLQSKCYPTSYPMQIAFLVNTARIRQWHRDQALKNIIRNGSAKSGAKEGLVQ